jgi:hypothetical protein
MKLDSRSPEETAAIWCVQTYLGAGRDGPVENLFGPSFDWESLANYCERNHVRPLVYRVLLDSVPTVVPKNIRDRYRNYREKTTKRNLQLAGELSRLVDSFRDESVPVLPYKGPTLAATAYDDVSLREFGDLDLIIRKTDFDRARDLLRQNGYEIQYESSVTDDLTDRQQSLSLEFGRGYEFRRESGLISVDLHWRFLPPRSAFPVEFADIWDRRETVSVAGADLPTLSTIDTLLLLCVHGTRHGLRHLRGVCDVATLVQTRQIGWETAVHRAKELGCRRRLGVALQLARELLDIDLPDSVVERVIDGDRAIPSLVETMHEWLFDRQSGLPGETLRFKYQMHERRGDRLAFLLRWGLYPHQKEIEWVSLPGPLRPLYYPLRPVRLLREAGSRLLSETSG